MVKACKRCVHPTATKLGILFMLRGVFLFSSLFLFVLLVNFSIISLDMMYPEQPLMYAANQTLHSFHDFLNIYLHPQMFHLSILFFRPSGHFLIYQILGPFLGWHNTQGFIVVNLGFLALSGFVMIKLYHLLFPRFRLGGYIAFSVYLMHPALILSRLITLHFEFAHIFFVILSVYCFVQYCQNNKGAYLFASILCFIIAVTFKEPAIMLGPVLFAYYCVTPYKPSTYKSREILALLIILSLALGFYLSLQWPSWYHPMRTGFKLQAVAQAAEKFFILTFGWGGEVRFPPPVWRNIVFPWFSRILIGTLALSCVATLLLLFSKAGNNTDKKSLIFLFLSTSLFLLLPLSWAWGLPWHLNLSLVFLALIMGYSCEFIVSYLMRNRKLILVITSLFALVLGLSTIFVNQDNINYYLLQQGYALKVGHNAVFNPPDIRRQLNDASLVVVEDSQLRDSYLLGASIYPYAHILLNKPNLNPNEEQGLEEVQSALFLKQQPLYNGSLFTWAYLKPDLHEEVYPFSVDHMDTVPDMIIYAWLKHQHNIFCLGYDKNAHWHDRSSAFKKNLAQEQLKRHLIIHKYDLSPKVAIKGRVMQVMQLAFADPQICQWSCDQNKSCQGFTYVNVDYLNKPLRQCYFYDSISENDRKFCRACVGFVKKLS